MTLDYQSIPPSIPLAARVREVGRALIGLGAFQLLLPILFGLALVTGPRENWPTLQDWVFPIWCLVSGLSFIICGIVIREKRVPVIRWIALATGAPLVLALIWKTVGIGLELFSRWGSELGPFFAICVVVTAIILRSFLRICIQLHEIAKDTQQGEGSQA